MNLNPYIDDVQRQLLAAAESGGDEARAVAARLAPALEAAVRLAVQDALAAAAHEITLELAPGSVELRLRGRDPEFVVAPAPAHADPAERDPAPAPLDPAEVKGGAMARINLRMPEGLRDRIEAAAAAAGISVNAWLVRAVAAAADPAAPDRRAGAPRGSQSYTGWAR
ncbi:MAG: toxin-antitoxin system HicB family antitoxin [Thermoleophilia bacterium]